MKQALAVESAARPTTGNPPGAGPRLLLALVPVVSLGLLGALPSLVLAWRTGRRAEWLAAVGFTAVTVAWLFEAVLTPEETHGAAFGLDLLLMSAATVGAAAHCLCVRPGRGERA
ncbi:hypothetical protein NX801_19740 [Streptomyces sp. LP05-1]|uniref:Uncharacterized protein n=1 Tax=Streptomyces pyxinae TaxID=2970734 RepID=A0ABT2CKB4_9ACTN|nr:hypothetical protein [Streptomyces sp. LP05-1]MCS0637854.1 hypothetical protein [Streptomyces sp. LP05-1]